MDTENREKANHGSHQSVVNQELIDGGRAPHRIATFLVEANLFMSFITLMVITYMVFFGPLSDKYLTCPLKEEDNFRHLVSSIPFGVSWTVLYFGRYFYGAKKVAALPQGYNPDDLVECVESTFRNLELGFNNNGNWQPNKDTRKKMQVFANLVIDPTTMGMHPCNSPWYLSYFASHLTFVVYLAVEMFYERCNHQAKDSAMTIFITGFQLGMLVSSARLGRQAGWGSKMRLHAQRIRARMHTGGAGKQDGNSRSVEWWHQQLTRLCSQESKYEDV